MAFGDRSSTEDLRTLVLRATQCGLDIQRDLRSYDADGIRLTLHIAVGAGELFTFHLGGINHHWEYFPAGSLFGQISGALDKSLSGQTYLSQTAWEIVADACTGKENNVRSSSPQPPPTPTPPSLTGSS